MVREHPDPEALMHVNNIVCFRIREMQIYKVQPGANQFLVDGFKILVLPLPFLVYRISIKLVALPINIMCLEEKQGS